MPSRMDKFGLMISFELTRNMSPMYKWFVGTKTEHNSSSPSSLCNQQKEIKPTKPAPNKGRFFYLLNNSIFYDPTTEKKNDLQQQVCKLNNKTLRYIFSNSIFYDPNHWIERQFTVTIVNLYQVKLYDFNTYFQFQSVLDDKICKWHHLIRGRDIIYVLNIMIIFKYQLFLVQVPYYQRDSLKGKYVIKRLQLPQFHI